MKDTREETDPAPWVIEFRSGSFFRAAEDDRGSSFDEARRFATEADASAVMDRHAWIYINGGMARQIGTGRDWPGAKVKP